MRDDKLFFRVRQQMYALRVNQEDIAQAIGRSSSYVSMRCAGKHSSTWRISTESWTSFKLHRKIWRSFSPEMG